MKLIRDCDDTDFKSLWDDENQELLSIIKIRKLKYLYDILNQRGCIKLTELLDKHRKNPFFEFIDNNN